MARIAVLGGSQHCIDCGFLSYQRGPAVDGVTPASPDFDPTPRCFRGAFDLAGETQQLLEHDTGLAPAETDACDPRLREREAGAAEEVVHRARSCSAFTRLRAGRSFEDHLELQEQESDRRWTLLVALGGMLTGSALTLLATAVVLLLR